MAVIVEISVVGTGTADNLKVSVDEYFIRRCRTYPPDSRFDWSTAQCNTVEIEQVKTPIPKVV